MVDCRWWCFETNSLPNGCRSKADNAGIVACCLFVCPMENPCTASWGVRLLKVPAEIGSLIH